LIVAPNGIFIVFSVFFFSLQLHPVHVCTDRDTVHDPAPFRDRNVAALRADIRGFAVIYRFRYTGRSAEDPSAPNIGRNGNAPPRFVVVSIRFFIAFFLVVFFFDLMPMPILVLAFIVAQTAALSLRAEFLAVTRPSALLASTLSAACLSVRSLF